MTLGFSKPVLEKLSRWFLNHWLVTLTIATFKFCPKVKFNRVKKRNS